MPRPLPFVLVCVMGCSHKMISASIKASLGEAKHEVTILRQEEKNLELLRSVEGEWPEQREMSI